MLNLWINVVVCVCTVAICLGIIHLIHLYTKLMKRLSELEATITIVYKWYFKHLNKEDF